MNTLTTKQEELCSYGGGFGALLSLTCLIQHLIVMTSHWIAVVMVFLYLFSIIAFIILIMQKSIAPALLIVSASLIFIAEALLILAGVFSLVVVLLLVYSIVMILVLYMGEFHKKFKEKARLLQEEQKAWEGKI